MSKKKRIIKINNEHVNYRTDAIQKSCNSCKIQKIIDYIGWFIDTII